MPQHDVLASIDERFGKQTSADWLTGIARIALESENVGDCQLGVVITGDDEVRTLNRDYAGDDHETDVLAFSLTEGEEFTQPDDTRRLGEVIISMETAARQASDAGVELDSEVAHLLVHGVLHVLGYDHLEPGDEAAMRARERAILEIAGLSAH